MRKYMIAGIVAVVTVPCAARADMYVAGRIGVRDLFIDAYQYMDYSADSPRSVIVDDTIDDINAVYHGAVGYNFDDTFRVEFEYGYGKYTMSGNWSLNTKNMVPDMLPPNISYPSTYELINKVHTFNLNGYFNVFTFDRRFKNGLYTDINMLRECSYDALYVMMGVGMAHIRDSANVNIDTTMAWGGNAQRQYDSNTLNRFTYSAGIGMAFGLSKDFSIDIMYKYTHMGDYDMGTTSRDYSAHEMTLGLRYEF